VVVESIQLLRSALSKRIEIRTRIEPGLPQVSADASDIFQALMNLATNASHAMKENGGLLEISLQRETITEQTLPEYPGLEPGGHVRLAVKDSGAGMAPEVAERIFEPFFTTKPPGEGTGLGLSVVHGIVKSHRGVIFVESELGVGTTFEIYFPAPADLPAAPSPSESNAAA
jgi:two-component system cell cycle sensor histidine kinase/response regulator CckA